MVNIELIFLQWEKDDIVGYFAVINGNAEKCNKSHSGQGEILSHKIKLCMQYFLCFFLEKNKTFLKRSKSNRLKYAKFYSN